jgi:Ino eighty subunit 1
MNHRARQISYTLDKRIRRVHAQARGNREAEGPILRSWKRIRAKAIDYDSEEERIKIRKAKERAEKDDDWRLNKGKENVDLYTDLEPWQRPRVYMAGLKREQGESSDVGEEARSFAQTFGRCRRRLTRWEESFPGDAMIKRRQLQAQGLLHSSRRRRAVLREPLMEQDGLDVMGDRYGSRSRGRNSRTAERMDVEGEEDEAAELDEEDRELLGEVDAGESEEDEDEDMGDD